VKTKHILIVGRLTDIHVARWCNALAGRGYKVSAATVQDYEGAALSGEVVVFRLASDYMPGINALRDLAHRLKPDIIHVHYAGMYGLMARMSGVRVNVISAYGTEVFEVPDYSFIHRWLIKGNLRNAEKVGSTSRFMARRIQELVYGLPVSVTPFGVDTTVFKKMREERNEDEIRIGTVKKLEKKYGVDILIRAFTLLRKNKPDARLKLEITGTGSEESSLKNLAASLGIANDVCFHGFVSHQMVPQMFNRLDIFVAASRFESESFGVSVIEASACELPVVVSNIGGLPEVVKNGETGLLVPAENATALADSLAYLVDNPDLRQKFGKAGRNYVQQNYEWADCVDTMIKLYESCKLQANSNAGS
jgi:glycosyltransferase involved in cell wall biosynthesis